MPPEFSVSNPLIISIHKHNGDWVIQPIESIHQAMIRRAAELPSLDGEWGDRRSFGASRVPEFRSHPHVPIVLRYGESVKFICDHDFVAWVGRDPNCRPNANGPGDPFGWRLPQASNDRVLVGTVLSPSKGQPDPALQRFYKCYAWVFDGEETVYVDPDVICDGR